jgi:hypothetical protein
LDGFDAAPDDEDIDAPEKKETEQGSAVEVRGGGPENAEHGINGLTTDPGLNAKPAASDESAKDGGNVGATDTEGSAHKDGEGDAVFGAGMGIEEHGNQDDEMPRRMVKMACSQFMPTAMRPEASM